DGNERRSIMTPRSRAVLFGALVLLASDMALAATELPNLLACPNNSGVSRTCSSNGGIDTSNPFFQSLGTNGRACVTCHDPSTGFTITPALVQAKFAASDGLDPIFTPNDGTNSPNADMATVDARRAASSMLLTRGLIRVGLGIPDNAEFELVACDDPYGFASASELSLFRRPLPSTNLRCLSAVMWDGRENQLSSGVDDRTIALDLRASLAHQANDATRGHAQAVADLTPEQQQQIVDFETALSSAQAEDHGAGRLDAHGAAGGPVALAFQSFFLGINDPLGNNPSGADFNRAVFTTFDAWAQAASPHRQAIARGQALFNTKPIAIRGVAGLNDDL